MKDDRGARLEAKDGKTICHSGLAGIFLQNNPLHPPFLRGNQKDSRQAGMTDQGKLTPNILKLQTLGCAEGTQAEACGYYTLHANR